MSYQTDRQDKCKASYLVLQGHTEDEYGEPLYYPCNWVSLSTYIDECTVCGAVAVYG